MADIPQTTGQPDRGAGAFQFTGHTLYDRLVAREMDVAERPGKLMPGLATSWEATPSDRTKWVFRLRPGVTFHDGSAFNVDALIWNFEKVLNADAPHFESRQARRRRGGSVLALVRQLHLPHPPRSCRGGTPAGRIRVLARQSAVYALRRALGRLGSDALDADERAHSVGLAPGCAG
jgi:hypothetical protein